MDTENSICGLKNTQIMDMKMAETLKRKKHRRGKKNRMGRKSPGNVDVFSTFAFDKNPYIKHGRRSRKFMRPTSPKAPMNSTQFLIEDRRQLDLDSVSPFTSHSPVFQGLSPEIEDFTSVSFYDIGSDRKQTGNDEEVEYMPIDFDDTVDFIEQEFEKDLTSHQNKDTIETVKANCCSRTRRELSKLPKFTIIQKMFELEAKLKRLEDDRTENHTDLKMKTEQLRRENSELKSENFLLRNLMS